MKNIPYRGTLSEDIITANENFNLKNSLLTKFFISFFTIAIPSVLAVKFNILPTDLQNIYFLAGGNLGISTIFSFSSTVMKSRKINKKVHKASKNILSLISELENNDIIVDDRNISEAKVIRETKTVVRRDDEDRKISNEEIITEEFYLLNREEQIIILRQVRNYLYKLGSKNPIIEKELSLLEDDYDKTNIPVRKVLRKK